MIDTETKRIFIALPAENSFTEPFQKFIEQHGELEKVAWLEPKNLHVTLLPPVEVNPDQLAYLKTVLSTIRGHKPQEISFKEITVGPTDDNPRLLWATGESNPEILNLKSEIERLVDYTPDREFKLHTTLGRFASEDYHNSPIENFHEMIHWHLLVKSFVIMESHFNNHKADYRILAEFPLYE